MNKIFRMFGDSHCLAFDGLFDETEWIGATNAATMYSFNTLNYNFFNPLHVTIFTFGEIDCRFRVSQQPLPNELVIKQLVTDYMKKIIQFKKLYCLSGVGIYNIVPTSKKNQRDITGTLEERQENVKVMNQMLKDACESVDIPFLYTFDLLVGQDGYFREDLIDDSVHLVPFKNDILSDRVNKFKKLFEQKN